MSAMQTIRRRGGPLEGVRVLELTKVWAGPYAGKQLSYLGAEVIRIESEGSLDVTRTFGVDDINKAPGFMAVNPQKLSAQINMKLAEGLALLKKLVAKCDIVIENLRPGAMKRLGLDYEGLKSVKSDIILVSMSMWGQEGPLAYQTGYAPLFVALGGVSALVGYEGEAPSGMNVRYADSTFGTAAAFAAVAALNHRRQTGEGQYVDISAVETMTSMIGDTVLDFGLTGHEPAPNGNRHPTIAPHGVYSCKDGEWIAIAAPSEESWRALCGVIESGDIIRDERFRDAEARKTHEAALDALLTDWTSGKDASLLSQALQSAGVPSAKSANSVDLIAEESFWARGFYRDVKEPGGAERAVIGPAWRMSDGAELTDGAPQLGQHNDYVFGEVLGLSKDERARLKEKGVMK